MNKIVKQINDSFVTVLLFLFYLFFFAFGKLIYQFFLFKKLKKKNNNSYWKDLKIETDFSSPY